MHRPPEEPGLNSPYTEDETNDFLQKEAPSTWYGGPLKYLGEALSKLGRPVRAGLSALTGGTPDWHEGLAWLPFSDTAGLTNPANAVTGDKLAHQWGWNQSEDHPFWSWDTAKALGIDVATDPLTIAAFPGGVFAKGVATGGQVAAKAASPLARAASYLPEILGGGRAQAAIDAAAMKGLQAGGRALEFPIGTYTGNLAKSPLTNAGKLLAGVDKLPQSTGMMMRGLDAQETIAAGLADLAHGPMPTGSSNPLLAAKQLFTDPAKQQVIEDLVQAASQGTRTPLSGAARFSLPFTGGRVGLTVGTDPITRYASQAITFPFGGAFGATEGLGNLLGKAPYVGGVFRTPLDKLHMDTTTKQLESQFAIPGYEAMQVLHKAGKGADVSVVGDALRNEMELPGLTGGLPGVTPAQQTAVGQAADLLRPSLDEGFDIARTAGRDVKRLQGNIDYAPRGLTPQIQQAKDAMPSAPNALAGGAGKAGMLQREFPEAGSVLDDIMRDPVLRGTGRTAVDDAAAQAHALATYGGNPMVGPVLPGTPHPWVGRAGGIETPERAASIANFMRDLPQEAGQRMYNNPIQDFVSHGYANATKSAAGDVAQRQLALGAMDRAELLALGKLPPSGTTPLGRAAATLGIETPEGLEELARKVSAFRGQTVGVADLDKFVVENALPASVAQLTSKALAKPADNAMLRAVDWYTNLWKTYQTVPFAGHHLQNFFGGVFQNVASGTITPFSVGGASKFYAGGEINGLRQLQPFAHYATDAEATEALARTLGAARQFEKRGHLAGELTGAAVGQHLPDPLALPGVSGFREIGWGSAPRLQEDWWNPLAVRGAGTWPTSPQVGGASKFLPARFGEGMLEMADKWNRMVHTLGRLEQGLTLDGSVASAMAHHVDYTKLSNFERQYLRRLAPFYTYSRLMVPQVISQTMMEPGKMVATLHAMQRGAQAADQNDSYTPEWMRSSTVFPIGDATEKFDPASGRREKNQVFGQLPSLPIEDVMRWYQPGPHGLERSLTNLGSNLNPLLKLGVEKLTGKDLQTQQDAENFGSGVKWWQDPTTQHLKQAAQYIPILPRAVTTGIRIAKGLRPDSDLTPLQVLSGELGSPVRFREVETLGARRRDAQRALDESKAETHGATRTSEWHLSPEYEDVLKGQPDNPTTRLWRASAGLQQQDSLESLYRKIENAQRSKEELASLDALRTRRPLDAQERQRYSDLFMASQYEDVRELQAAQLQQKMDMATGVPGLKRKLPGQYGRKISVTKRGVSTPQE